jgi:hypothetical protein
MKTYTITQEQFSLIRMGLQLGEYFVDDQEPSNDSHESDSQSIESALKAFDEIYNQEVQA